MAETSNPSVKRCALVTGGNKGIGFEICRKLAANGLAVISTARSELKGREALEKLQASGLSDVFFHQLDIKDSASIAALAKFVEINFRTLDILVNNAAIPGLIIVSPEKFIDGGGFVNDENAQLLKGIIEEDYELAEDCLRTNYYGAKAVTAELLPLLKLSDSARIVNMTGTFGELKWICNVKVKAELDDVENLTEEKIDEIAEWFLRDFKENKLKANGWPIKASAFKISKAAINAYTRLLARNHPNISVNCVHPGYVQTDITSGTGPLTPEEGARAPTMVALLPNNGPSGIYFSEMQPSDF
ncbi:hypothetical protein DCAR_0100373 [Daucus carota subsp. sativus]|uniref:Uncharacterized protein n=1 Tax=Daucus carota subsp. sativus TaxID=79200 RepID=A0A166FLX5_DAUCS|nr:hypothetical protein DCAR_0100373 [Daucus carota subsp. sativus]